MLAPVSLLHCHTQITPKSVRHSCAWPISHSGRTATKVFESHRSVVSGDSQQAYWSAWGSNISAVWPSRHGAKQSQSPPLDEPRTASRTGLFVNG